jgi:hypothetical protein
MNKYLVLAAAMVVGFGSIPASADAALTVSQHEQNGAIHVNVAAPSGGAGWQAYSVQSVPQGKNLIFTYTCPDTAPTPINGAFNPTPATRVGLSLVANIRPSTIKDAWYWAIDWPSGAPANAKIVFNIYCVQ